MKIELQEDVGGASVRLSVENVPMTAMGALMQAFTSAVEAVGGDALPAPQLRIAAPAAEDGSDGRICRPMTQAAIDAAVAHARAHMAETNTDAPTGEVRRGRGRPRKHPLPGEATQNPLPEAAATDAGLAEDKEPGNGDAVPATNPPTSEPATGETGIEETLNGGATAVPVQSLPAEKMADSIVTDTELQRFSARLAQHFGNPQKVFDLAGKYAPEGTVPRPTNIRDNAQRWAFIRAAEVESGLTYHG